MSSVTAVVLLKLEAEKQASLELALGTYAGPLIKHKMSHVIKVHKAFSDQIDTLEISVGA